MESDEMTRKAEMGGMMTADLLGKLEGYGFWCKAGRLEDCLEWVVLRQRFPERTE